MRGLGGDSRCAAACRARRRAPDWRPTERHVPVALRRARHRSVLQRPRARRAAVRGGDRLESKGARVAEPYQSPKLQLAKALLCTAQLARARTAAGAARATRSSSNASARRPAVSFSSTELEVRAGNLAQAEAYATSSSTSTASSAATSATSGTRAASSRCTSGGSRTHDGSCPRASSTRVRSHRRSGSPTTSGRSVISSSRRAISTSRGRPRPAAADAPRDGARRVVGASVPPGPDRDARRARRDRRGGRADGRARGVRPPARSSVGPRDRGPVRGPHRLGARKIDEALEEPSAHSSSTNASTGRSSAPARSSFPVGFSAASGAAATPRDAGRGESAFAALRNPLWLLRPRPKSGGSADAAARRRAHPTEARVAELAGQGLRNAEIASQLYVTPKTVEATLSRVYRKLGVRSRTELAGRLAAGLRPAASSRKLWGFP